MTIQNNKAPVHDIFVCYSHEDQEWLGRVKASMRQVEGSNTRFDHVEIKPGAPWFEKFKEGIRSTRVALFFVSPNFIASEFTTTEGISDLLDVAAKRGVPILWLTILPTDKDHRLSQYTALNEAHSPLSLLIDSRQEQELIAICQKIQAALTNLGIATQKISDTSPDMSNLLIQIEKLAASASSPKSVLQKLAAQLNEMALHYGQEQTADSTLPSREDFLLESSPKSDDQLRISIQESSSRSTLAVREDLLLSIPFGIISNISISFAEKSTVILGWHTEETAKTVDIDLSRFGDVTMGISRIHAALEKQDNGDITIRDLKSTNGTWINQHKLAQEERRKLKSGDLIKLGYLVLVVMDISSEHK